jgi:anthranilate phosphoribosyltransferase
VTQDPGWAQILAALVAGRDLEYSQAAWAMTQLMAGTATPAQVAGFLIALRAKGETVTEVTGLVEAMLGEAVPLTVAGDCVDILGTGGDLAHTVNISTMASLVVAGAGQRVVKHGNRAASSLCGSADVLEELGVTLDLPPQRVAEVAEEVGITFCFAQAFHPAARHAAGVRRELGVPTIFNFLGPLTNPAQPQASAIGVADATMAPLMASVMAARGRTALVFRGDDGLDELTISGPSTLWLADQSGVRSLAFVPQEFGIEPSPVTALRGGDRAFNAAAVHQVLAGQPGPIRQAVVLNAAAGLVAVALAAEATGTGSAWTDDVVADRFRAALAVAATAIDSGAAATVLARWIEATRR